MTAAPLARGPHGLAAVLFALVWISCSWFGSWEFNANNGTRLYGAIALAEHGRATIDEFQDLTIDKARFGDHWYIDKAPGITLLATPVVWAVDRVTGDKADDYTFGAGDWPFGRYMRLRMRLTAWAVCATLTALAAVLVMDWGTGLTGNPAAGTAAALAYALGSPIWGFSGTIFGHAPAAALLVIAAWAVWRGSASLREWSRWRYPLLAGGTLGAAVTIEFPAAIPGLVIAAWGLWRLRVLPRALALRTMALTIAAGLVLVAPVPLYNLFAFGTPFKLGYSGVVGFDGMQQGLFGLTWPKPATLWAITLGFRRGLVWLAPALVLAPWGLWRLWRGGQREVVVLAIAAALAVLCVNASYFYWDGGNSTGPRHALPAVAFLALGVAGAWRREGAGRWLAIGLLALALPINLLVAAADTLAPPEYAFPLLDPVWTQFRGWNIRTLPSECWGWSPARGLALYLALAIPLLGLVCQQALRAERAAD
ncbi:hypothetical protein [Sphingomonas aracearum]|uniref:Glycosyltransferase RgtA/B/C/D-like domain-containing protein n=1 Tax=Sphingomonas aracearum TaxID=2283317 RepID=A0A369VUA0_9SPHN|nr:hypothetical protein [Sphingomonas aracearum]RDE04770.1 hypothetical protein DVW87_14410 [Sphingomonas aracearum]